MMIISAERLTVQTLLYIFWQIVCFFSGRPRIECIINIAKFLTSINIIYSKLFQTLSAGANILTVKEMKFLSQYNDSAPYSSVDTYNIYDVIDELNCISEAKSKDVLILKPGIEPRSGMIAIVYYCRLGDIDVVIKVKRRGIKEKLCDGIEKMEFILWLIGYIPYLNKLNLHLVFQENKQDMLNQCDFNDELNNMRVMKHNFRNINYVTIPIAYEQYTKINSNIIVMEQIKGKRLHDGDFYVNNEMKSLFGVLVAKFNAKSILYDRLYHADLHAGNIFFDDSTPDSLKIGIIDFGLVGKMSKLEQEKLFSFFQKILVDNDPCEASKIILTHLVLPKDKYQTLTFLSSQILHREITNIAKELINSAKELDVRTAYKINSILCKHGMTLSREFSKIQLALAISGNVCNDLCSTGTSYTKLAVQAVSEMTKCIGSLNEYSDIRAVI